MDKKLISENGEYLKFLNDLKTRIKQARISAYRSVNKELIDLYWKIGKSIVEKQKKLGWGQKIIQRLADDLQKEIPRTIGFSYANLDRMRKFYITYVDSPKLAQVVREIPWGQNVVIIEKCSDTYRREYYLRMTIKYGWSRNILIHQIESRSFDRYMSEKKTHNFARALPAKIAHKADLVIGFSAIFAYFWH
ncbi:hypothetical protein COY52_07650 [Candidatus Desantisbacteria bacterium CG_4_10_14_0_8_um_filter_48_22]|uniref:YhcG N-terminal domain-containing protein n=1 Tax=Candidatus Desantisbacteria bacterium CG_4_10_14_0_8_um_filter_48_22 TaxID=1974543 RepID=A0A2M7SAB5_9BACT|nr:MAG: hypothetical protein AUJ67_00555 [Candidatus Desantisbacteria bacterium CG1_02_49_89]PIV56975.1 MAG: hypothetical protein COS16_02385 [Candidatus Desantisbacteria bacterium CG02_land_8_20_14_3_00_49_13]PIZ16233.1 MAG: hypothetical protein COY52_07650 [Candidatus Desantisbacteria bacterium CG_4_10_14_0_8_um_filter_48_22]